MINLEELDRYLVATVVDGNIVQVTVGSKCKINSKEVK